MKQARVMWLIALGAVAIAALSFAYLVGTIATALVLDMWSRWGYALPIGMLVIVATCYAIGYSVQRWIDRVLGIIGPKKIKRDVVINAHGGEEAKVQPKQPFMRGRRFVKESGCKS